MMVNDEADGEDDVLISMLDDDDEDDAEALCPSPASTCQKGKA